MKMVTEIGVMRPQAKECQEPPEAGKRQRMLLPWSLRGSTVLLTSEFGTSGLQSFETMHICCLKSLSVS